MIPDVETAGTLAVPMWLAWVGSAAPTVSLFLAIKKVGASRCFLDVSRRPDRGRRPCRMALCGTARGGYHWLDCLVVILNGKIVFANV
jgi:hypothetical protein